MNFKQLETFYWAARLGSFTAAAERLHATQSTISMRIHDLEADLGVALFDRSQRAARITPRGRELVHYAERMLDLAAELRERIASPDSIPGSVRLGVAEMVSVTWLPELVRVLHERHPRVAIELDEALTDELMARMQAGQLDMLLAPVQPGTSQEAGHSLGSVSFAWMASPELALPAGRLGPAELQNWPIIALSPTSAHHARIDAWFRAGGAFCRRMYSCKSFGVAASLAAAGLGVTLLPPLVYAEEVQRGRLRIVDTAPPMAPVAFHTLVAPGANRRVTGLIAALAAEVSTFRGAA